mgnify:CR=1 FL=1
MSDYSLLRRYLERVTDALDTFDWEGTYQRLESTGEYSHATVLNMVVQLTNYCAMRKRMDVLPKLSAFFGHLNDEDERHKITIDHLLYVIANCEEIYKKKPPSPINMYM